MTHPSDTIEARFVESFDDFVAIQHARALIEYAKSDALTEVQRADALGIVRQILALDH